MKKIAVLVVCIVMIATACKKTENSGLVGKWRLTETYDDYANGGSFSWNKVEPKYSHILEFTSDGQYSKIEELNGNTITCGGTYQQAVPDTVEIASTCQTIVQKIKISELSAVTLVLDYQVREGIIKYKYVAQK